ASDAAQYHSSNLAPTARYDELASLDRAYAGRGPALFTDFDEYALYELRDLDVGGPDFAYPPPALRTIAAGRGTPVEPERTPPSAPPPPLGQAAWPARPLSSRLARRPVRDPRRGRLAAVAEGRVLAGALAAPRRSRAGEHLGPARRQLARPRPQRSALAAPGRRASC